MFHYYMQSCFLLEKENKRPVSNKCPSPGPKSKLEIWMFMVLESSEDKKMLCFLPHYFDVDGNIETGATTYWPLLYGAACSIFPMWVHPDSTPWNSAEADLHCIIHAAILIRIITFIYQVLIMQMFLAFKHVFF